MKGLLLLSGGLDSAACLSLGLDHIMGALTFDYGQRAAPREILASQRLCEYFSIPHEIMKLSWMSSFQNALTQNFPLPKPRPEDLINHTKCEISANAVWVANRNGVFLEIAASIAESRHLDSVIVGFNQEEAETFPDNSESYVDAINGALRFSTRNQVLVTSPTLQLTKIQIVGKLKNSGFPWQLLWSCYENADAQCGVCESCQRLKRALQANEVDFHGFTRH